MSRQGVCVCVCVEGGVYLESESRGVCVWGVSRGVCMSGG